MAHSVIVLESRDPVFELDILYFFLLLLIFLLFGTCRKRAAVKGSSTPANQTASNGLAIHRVV